MIGTSTFRLEESGFAVYALRSHLVEVRVADLGAKIISLKNLETGREWMWRPPGPLRLFRNEPGDAFADSPLVGADECFPTISPCEWMGRSLPDHGEIWGIPCTIEEQAWDRGFIKTSAHTKTSPFMFERVVTLQDNEVRLDYRVKSLSRKKEMFLWSLHPLLEIEDGDRIELPRNTRSIRIESAEGLPDTRHGSVRPWPEPVAGVDLESMDFSVYGTGFVKLFAESLNEGRAALSNSRSGERLVFEFDTQRNGALGVWINRGGWHGYEHVALEPTNLASDSLAVGAHRDPHTISLPPEGEKTWTIKLRLERL